MLSQYFRQVPACSPDSSENPPAPIRVHVLQGDYLKCSAVMSLRGVNHASGRPWASRPRLRLLWPQAGRTAKDDEKSVIWEISLLKVEGGFELCKIEVPPTRNLKVML